MRHSESASRPRSENEIALVRAMDEVKRHVIHFYEGWPKKVKTEPYFMINSRTDGLQ
jgi:hypothetical protein